VVAGTRGAVGFVGLAGIGAGVGMLYRVHGRRTARLAG
jgi:hypothetical protein